MKGSRHNVTSVDEPNAFRIARATRSPDISNSPHHDVSGSFSAEYSAAPTPTFSQAGADFQPSNVRPYEPASWLAAPDLSSASFSAHDFLQRILPQRYDKGARPTHLPVLEDSFDADAALAALDTVESALRKKRDSSRREEEVARDELRKALHLSAKKREQLLRSAETVYGNASTFGDVGRQAASALGSDIAALKSLAERLSRLQDARDLVSLLTTASSGLDAVRVSRLLTKARRQLEDGSLAAILAPDDLAAAREEMGRCESELSTSVTTWMRSAVNSGEMHVVRECALAAEELQMSQSFIDAYITHVFSIGQSVLDEPLPSKENFGNMSSDECLERFREACWVTTNSAAEMIPTICDSFPKPATPAACVLRIVSQKRVIPMAEDILSSLLGHVSVGSADVIDGRRHRVQHARGSDFLRTTHSSVSRARKEGPLDGRELRKEQNGRTAEAREKFLVVCTEISKAMTKLKRDLVSQCRVPGAGDAEEIFPKDSDPFAFFVQRWASEYLKSEKTWVDEQLGSAYLDITRIEAHAPRLAPRETSDASVYHRYRTFYCRIAAQYQQMTRGAIESTYEALCRGVAFMSGLSTFSDSNTKFSESPVYSVSPQKRAPKIPLRQERSGPKASTVRENQNHCTEYCEDEGIVQHSSESSPNTFDSAKVNSILREFLDGLVMNYLANSETILQAATHLLPVSEGDAANRELWVSGVSPLTAYMQAVEVLSRSNEMLDEFLLTLELADNIPEADDASALAEGSVEALVPQEVRERLHRELMGGLADLGIEAQVGVRAAVASVRAHLFAILSTPTATEAYTSGKRGEAGRIQTSATSFDSEVELELETSPAYMCASSFIEQQLQSILSTVHGGNRGYVVSELSIITREAVLQSWCSCKGPISVDGALQLVADGRAMARVFRGQNESLSVVECLPAVGRLFLDSADALWSCVESKALASVEARTLVELLRKREDHHAERVLKVCQSLGATLEELKGS